MKNHREVPVKSISHGCFVGDLINVEKKMLHPFIKLLLDEKCFNSEFFIGNTFFHYRGGSNWDRKSDGYHKDKTNTLCKSIEMAISG